MNTDIQIFRNREHMMRAYVDTGNVLQVNAEDAAYGLGYTAIGRNGTERVNWSKVKSILKDFGYTVKKLGAGAYIPEQMFWLLAMRADSPAAKAFQTWAATDVFPAIRKHGFYAAGDFNDLLWRKTRLEGIAVRKSFAQMLKIFIEYARLQGDRRDGSKIYAEFTSIANSLASIPDGARDDATAEQLDTLARIENTFTNYMMTGMAQRRYYARLEMDAKLVVTDFAKFAFIRNPLLGVDNRGQKGANLPATVRNGGENA